MILYSFPITNDDFTTIINLHDSDTNAEHADNVHTPNTIHFAFDSYDVYCESYDGCTDCALQFADCYAFDLIQLARKHTPIQQTHPELFI